MKLLLLLLHKKFEHKAFAYSALMVESWKYIESSAYACKIFTLDSEPIPTVDGELLIFKSVEEIINELHLVNAIVIDIIDP